METLTRFAWGYVGNVEDAADGGVSIVSPSVLTASVSFLVRFTVPYGCGISRRETSY